MRARALQCELAYELIAARADLQRIVLAARDGAPMPDVRTLQGWRREVVGDELLELLDGPPLADDRPRPPRRGQRALSEAARLWVSKI